MRVVRNYLYNAGYQVLAIILPLITAPYISRILGAHGVGINAYTNSLITYFTLLASVGIGYYGNRQIAYVRENAQKLAQTFWEIQIVKTVTTILATVIFAIFVYFYDKYTIYLWLQALNLLAVAFDVSWLYMGVEDFKRTVMRNTIVKIISVIAIFVFVKDVNDIGVYIVILGLGNLLGNMILWPHLSKMLTKVKFSQLKPWQHLGPSVALFIPQIATQVYLQLNKTMLGVMIGTTASGFYQSSDNLVKMVLAIVTATGTVMLPHVSNAFAGGNHEKVNKLLYTSFDFVSAIAFPMSFGLAAISLKFAPVFYGKGFAPVGMAMMIEAIVILFIGWSNVIGLQYLLPTNKDRAFSTSVIIGAVVNIILNVPMIYLWGLNGAMLATVLSELAVTGYQLYVIRKLVSYRKLFTNTWKYLVASFVMFGIVFFVDQSFGMNLLNIVIEIFLGGIVYLIIIFLLKPSILRKLDILWKDKTLM